MTGFCGRVASVALLGWLVTLALGGPWVSPAGAQELGTDCILEDYLTVRSSEPAPGRRVTWVARPFLVCPDGTRIRSDSAVVYEDSGRAELIGNVRFDTPERELRSELADYFEREGRLLAREAVVFRDVEQGSEVRGDTLTYLEAGEFRPEERVTVSGGRPTATLPPSTEREDPGERSAYEVTGNRLRFEGDRFFWADGDVEVRREDLDAYSDSLAFDQREGRLILNRNARVVGDADMEGDQITLLMPEEVLEEVTIRGRGRLRTGDVEVRGEEIRIALMDEKIERLIAVHRTGEGEEERPRPRALTEEFAVEGDSIDVVAPEEVLETLFASGAARGERRSGDLPPLPEQEESPEDDPDEPQLPPSFLDRDWIEGDEIIARFEPVETPEGDLPEVPRPEPEDPDVQDERQYRLQVLEARGNARTLYRSPPDEEDAVSDAEEASSEDDPQLWPISYITANEIFVHMLDGAVERVEARGDVRGIQLDPEPTTAPETEASRAPGAPSRRSVHGEG